jgi:predicted PhzF superfamily epimerase YddE/YHI9
MSQLARIDRMGVIVTAPAANPGECDFVSRFFAPGVGIPEDPVTGSAHCTLIPYWARRLGKSTLRARQVSARGGELFCEDAGERVKMGGRAVIYLSGEIEV